MKIYLFLLVFVFSFGVGQDFFSQQVYLINHLIEKNGRFVRPFTNEPVYGDLYRYFIMHNNKKSDKVFIGIITKTGKQGYWTRFWDNGQKKEEGYYINSMKDNLWIEWDADGSKFAEIFYKNGKVIHLTNCILSNCD